MSKFEIGDQFYLDGVPALTLYARELEGERRVDGDLKKETRLDILVENLGRVNYGRSMAHQRKGIDGDVLVNGRPHAGWGKGCVFVNGKNLGRFWDIGPQKRLYLAAPLLRQGKNDLVVLETEGRRGEGIALADAPDLGQTDRAKRPGSQEPGRFF